MPNINPMQFAMNMLQNNPQVMNNPQAYDRVIKYYCSNCCCWAIHYL